MGAGIMRGLALASMVVILASCSPDGAAFVEAKGVTLARLQILETALFSFKANHQRYPSEEEGLAYLSAGPEPVLLGNDLRSDDFVFDGWRRPFAYRPDDRKLILYSLGPNGIDEAGDGDDHRPPPHD